MDQRNGFRINFRFGLKREPDPVLSIHSHGGRINKNSMSTLFIEWSENTLLNFAMGARLWLKTVSTTPWYIRASPDIVGILEFVFWSTLGPNISSHIRLYGSLKKLWSQVSGCYISMATSVNDYILLVKIEQNRKGILGVLGRKQYINVDFGRRSRSQKKYNTKYMKSFSSILHKMI